MGAENQEIRKAGLKVTLPRIKVLQLLEARQNLIYECRRGL